MPRLTSPLPNESLLIVYWPEGKLFYPSPDPFDFDTDGGWSTRASIGTAGDEGKDFDLIVVSSDKEAPAELDAYLAQVHAADGHSPGMEALPSGSRRLAVVRVVRSAE